MDELRTAVAAYDRAVDAYKRASETTIVNALLGITEKADAALRVNIRGGDIIRAARAMFPQEEPKGNPDARYILMRTSTPDAYRYDHNVEVEVVGDYRILQCPSTYLAEYQIQRFGSGMETASPGIFESVELARAEATHLIKRGY